MYIRSTCILLFHAPGKVETTSDTYKYKIQVQGKESTSGQQLPDMVGEQNSQQESEGTQPQVGTDLNSSTSSQQSSSTHQEDSGTQDTTNVAKEGGAA